MSRTNKSLSGEVRRQFSSSQLSVTFNLMVVSLKPSTKVTINDEDSRKVYWNQFLDWKTNQFVVSLGKGYYFLGLTHYICHHRSGMRLTNSVPVLHSCGETLTMRTNGQKIIIHIEPGYHSRNAWFHCVRLCCQPIMDWGKHKYALIAVIKIVSHPLCYRSLFSVDDPKLIKSQDCLAWDIFKNMLGSRCLLAKND